MGARGTRFLAKITNILRIWKPGMVAKFYQSRLKTLKEQIARDMDRKPADH